MKKLISALLVLAMLVAAVMLAVALVSCTVEITPDETEKQTEAPASQSEPPSTQATEPPATEPPKTEKPDDTVSESETVPAETETVPAETETVPATESETETVTDSESETEPATLPPETSPATSYTVEKAADYADLDFAGKTFNIIYRWSPPSIKPSGWAGGRIAVGGGEVEDPSALHNGVEGVEQGAHRYNGPGHPAMASELPGEDEGAVEIVCFEQQQEHHAHYIGPPLGEPPQQQHDGKHRHFHQEPAQVVVQGRPPGRTVEFAISRIHKIQGQEHNDSQDGHRPQ